MRGFGRTWRYAERVANYRRGKAARTSRSDGSVDHLGSLAEILRTYRSGRDHAERLHVMDSVVIEPVNGAS